MFVSGENTQGTREVNKNVRECWGNCGDEICFELLSRLFNDWDIEEEIKRVEALVNTAMENRDVDVIIFNNVSIWNKSSERAHLSYRFIWMIWELQRTLQQLRKCIIFTEEKKKCSQRCFQS